MFFVKFTARHLYKVITTSPKCYLYIYIYILYYCLVYQIFLVGKLIMQSYVYIFSLQLFVAMRHSIMLKVTTTDDVFYTNTHTDTHTSAQSKWVYVFFNFCITFFIFLLLLETFSQHSQASYR